MSLGSKEAMVGHGAGALLGDVQHQKISSVANSSTFRTMDHPHRTWIWVNPTPGSATRRIELWRRSELDF